MSIWHILFQVLKKAKVGPAIITTIVVIIALAYMLFLQSLLMQADLDVYSNITALGLYATIERLLKAINELIVAYFIMLPFKLNATQYISEAMASRSPSSLLLMKDSAYTLNNAARRALQSLVENGLSVITPIVLLISRGAAISMYLNTMQLLIVISCLASVFLTGSAILAYDHRVWCFRNSYNWHSGCFGMGNKRKRDFLATLHCNTTNVLEQLVSIFNSKVFGS